jgi:hypothetical protein
MSGYSHAIHFPRRVSRAFSPREKSRLTLARSKGPRVAILLLTGTVCSQPRALAAGRPHMVFHLRAELDGQVWLVRADDEMEIGVERLRVGDACAVTGQLDVRTETDREGRKRIGFHVQARQVLFLRNRSVTKAAMVPLESQPMSDGYARPRVG